jgi:hypothetical protein
VAQENFKMKTKFLLAKYSDCYALLDSSEIKSRGGFMADTKGIYEVPDIDGFIGFWNVIACTVKKGNLPLIKDTQIQIPTDMLDDKCWIVNIEMDEFGSVVVKDGFVNIIEVKVLKK